MAENVFNGKLIGVRVEDGKEIVEHPGSVAIVPIDAQGRVLLVRQPRPAAGRDLLEIPAGTRDAEGEAPDETARRELREELGLEAEQLVHLGSLYPSPGYTTELQEVYLATGLRGDAPDAERLPLLEAISMLRTGEIRDMKTAAGLLLAGRAAVAPD